MAVALDLDRHGALVLHHANQAEHHAAKSFQVEFRVLLRRHEVEFDEQYVWD